MTNFSFIRMNEKYIPYDERRNALARKRAVNSVSESSALPPCTFWMELPNSTNIPLLTVGPPPLAACYYLDKSVLYLRINTEDRRIKAYVREINIFNYWTVRRLSVDFSWAIRGLFAGCA